MFVHKANGWILLAMFGILVLGSCAGETDQQRRDREEKMRQDTANATAKAKPALEAAGTHELVDLNISTKEDLEGLPGISDHDAHAIIDHRPYKDKHELVTRHIVTPATYDGISDRITVK